MRGPEYKRQWRKDNPLKVRQQKERRRARMLSIINRLKLLAGCMDCGYRENSMALQFDHVRGEKLFLITSRLNQSWEFLAAEMSKCDIVCANCHAIRTHKNREAKLHVSR